MSQRILVLDAQANQALSCVRSLGRAGYDVMVASTRRWPLAAWSRYATARYRLPDETVAAFAELRAWAASRGVTIVIPLTERTCILCNVEREAWEAAGITLACAPADTLGRAFDKARMLETAAASGVRIPPTRIPTSLAECREIGAAVGFPCVVKPRFSHAWDGADFFARSAPTYVKRVEDLDQAVLAAKQGDSWPLIQGYVPGQGKGVFALFNAGEPVAWFAHERLRDMRPSGSGSSLRRSIALEPRLREPAEALLRAMQWHGPAMVEFRDDGESPPFLMEVNGRFWTSLELAVRAGADFPRWWLDLLRGVAPPANPPYRTGVTVRWLWGDAKRLVHVLTGPPRGYPGRYPSVFQGLREFFGPQPAGTTLETWARGDVWPALGEWVQGFEEAMRRGGRRLVPRPAPHANGQRVTAARLDPPLRVLMITSDWPTPGRPRTTHFIKRQADFLQKAGVELDVFQFHGGQKLWNYIIAWFRARRRLRAGRYDLVHAQFGNSGLLALPKRVPLVVTYRGSDLLGIVGDADGRYTWRGHILQRLSRFVARRADAAIVVSDHMKAGLPKGIDATVVPSGLDFGLFRYIPREEARRQLGLAPDACYVLFVGRPHQFRKRAALAREAVAIVNRSLPAELLVAWGVEHTDMPLYMNAADVVICTSMQEGSPNSVKEALACDVPVVSVAVGDVPERLRGIEGCEVCADERPETIAAALERVLRRGGRVDGRTAVAALDESVLTQQVIDIYRAAAKQLPRENPVTVRAATPEEIDGWDALVRRFANHRVVHTRAWIESLEASGKGKPLYLVFEKQGETVGCLPGLVVPLGPLRVFGSSLPGWQTVSMGPAFDPARLPTAQLVGALIPFLETRYGTHHMELLSPDLDHAEMQASGFRGQPVYTYRAPLYPGDEERTFKSLKDSARRNIKRGVKLGLVPVFETDDAFIDEVYDQVREVFTRRGNSLPFQRRRLVEFFHRMRAAGNLVAISVYLPDRRTNIATGLFTIEGKELLLWMWAHRTQHRWYRPTELMTWTVMQRAMAAGCDTFDFMGRGDFKTKFGAQLEDTNYRWVRSQYRWLGLLRDTTEKVYRWQQAARGRIARLGSRHTETEPAGA